MDTEFEKIKEPNRYTQKQYESVLDEVDRRILVKLDKYLLKIAKVIILYRLAELLISLAFISAMIILSLYTIGKAAESIPTIKT
ncbi:MAG: hypothetical protein QXN35_00980 [Ignisphaera sp.]